MISGVNYFFKGIKLIFSPGVKRFVLIPLLMNVGIFTLGFWLGIEWLDQFLEKVLPAWLSWAEYILWPIFALSYFLIVFYLFALLANVIAAPFNSLLSEKIELNLLDKTSNESNSNIRDILKDLLPSIASELYKLIYLFLCLKSLSFLSTPNSFLLNCRLQSLSTC